MTDREPTGFPREIGAPATRALLSAGFTDVRQLDGIGAAHVAALHGVGPKALAVLQVELEQLGLSLDP